MTERVRGVDFAQFQAEPNFIELARDEALVFAIAKATEGQGYIDPKWERNLRFAPSAFEFSTCYHVLRGTSDGRIQADHAGRQWERLAVNCLAARTHAMAAVIDFESTDKKAADFLIANAVRFRERIEQITGLPPILYSYPSFLREQCGDAAPDELASLPQWPALYVGKKWADVAAGFDPYAWLRARRVLGTVTGSQLPAMWARAPWALYQYDGDKGETYKGTDYDFNVAQSRATLRALCGIPDTEPAPADGPVTAPHTPTSKSSQRLQAVREPIADLSLDSPATPIRAGEGEHTPAHLRKNEDD